MSPADRFLGNRAIVERLEARLGAGRLPHALIFSGPPGVGKRTYALRLIQALNCPDGGTSGCGECGQCRKVSRGAHPDVILISVEADATQIRIEQIRRMRSMLLLEPIEGRVRACVIDPAERLTPGAANALLKVLEEPPAGTYFFLITANAHELLPTIRSRSQVYHFAPLSTGALRELGVTDELVARWAQGSAGRAGQSDPEELRRRRDQMLAFLEGGFSGQPEALAELIGAPLAPSREDYPEAVRVACVLVSDLLALKVGFAGRVVNVDVQDRLASLAGSVDMDRLMGAAEQLKFIEANLRHHLNAQLMTDALLASLSPRNTA